MSSPSNHSLPAPAHILVVDDEPDLRTLYELTLLREGYRASARLPAAWPRPGPAWMNAASMR